MITIITSTIRGLNNVSLGNGAEVISLPHCNHPLFLNAKENVRLSVQ